MTASAQDQSPRTPASPQQSSGYPTANTSLLRPAIIGGVIAAITTIVAIVLGHPLFGPFFILGLVAVLFNAHLMVRNVRTVAASDDPRKQMLAVSSFGRLALITVFAFAIAFLVQPDGLGVMFGLAIGQVVLVLNTVIPVVKGLRKQP